MFFNKKTRQTVKSDTLSTLIDASVRITGEVHFDKSARIDGTVLGHVKGSNEKNGLLIIGPDARIEGDVRCHSIVVLGHIEGNVFAHYVEIRSSGRISGNVHYATMEIHQGSEINGNLLRQSLDQSDITPDPSVT
jgi:cytoskeletal protein CcmA (bactofilin family)